MAFPEVGKHLAPKLNAQMDLGGAESKYATQKTHTQKGPGLGFEPGQPAPERFSIIQSR